MSSLTLFKSQEKLDDSKATWIVNNRQEIIAWDAGLVENLEKQAHNRGITIDDQRLRPPFPCSSRSLTEPTIILPQTCHTWYPPTIRLQSMLFHIPFCIWSLTQSWEFFEISQSLFVILIQSKWKTQKRGWFQEITCLIHTIVQC